jgi:HK97 family phage portal protein
MLEIIQGTNGSRRKPPKAGVPENLLAYSKTPMYYAGLNLISESIASVEWDLYGVQDMKGKFYKAVQPQRAKGPTRRKVLKQLNADRIGDTHPLYALFDNPNRYLSGHAAIQLFQLHIDAVGEGYLLKQRNELGTPVALWPIPPSWVVDIPGAAKDYFTFRIESKEVHFPMSEVVWAKKPNPADPYGRGVGIGSVIADEIDTDEYASKFLKEFFYNDATPPIIITAPGATKDQVERVENRWMSKLRGVGKKFLPFFATWDAKVEKIGYSLDQLKMTDLREFEQRMIQRVLRIPPEKLGIIENSNRSTIDAADHIFNTNVLVPRIEFLRSVFQEQLVPDFDDRIILDYVSPVQEDRDFALKAMQARPQAFIDNEVRELAGYEDEAWGKDRWAPFTIAPLSTGGSVPAATESAPLMPLAPKQAKKLQHRVKELDPGAQAVIDGVLKAVTGPEMASVLGQSAARSIEVFGRRTLTLAGLSPDDFIEVTPAIAHYVEQETASRVTGIIDKTTRDALRAQLVEGFELGENIRDLSKRVESVFEDAKGRRATVIARTETVRSANFGAVESMRQVGIQDKFWLSSRDSRVREAHMELDGTTIPISGQFTSPVTGAQGGQPGGFGNPEDDIQCRCTTVPATDEMRSSSETVRKGVWKAAEADRLPIERQTKAGVIKALGSQQERVLSVLESNIGGES